MDQIGHAVSKTTLEIYAHVQKRVSPKNVHAAFRPVVERRGQWHRRGPTLISPQLRA